jgi:hypothetical protein
MAWHVGMTEDQLAAMFLALGHTRPAAITRCATTAFRQAAIADAEPEEV